MEEDDPVPEITRDHFEEAMKFTIPSFDSAANFYREFLFLIFRLFWADIYLPFVFPLMNSIDQSILTSILVADHLLVRKLGFY